MDKKEISYIATVKFSLERRPNEKEEDFIFRAKYEGKKTLICHLSGYCFDPNKNVFFENIVIDEKSR